MKHIYMTFPKLCLKKKLFQGFFRPGKKHFKIPEGFSRFSMTVINVTHLISSLNLRNE